jgi:hypothetical protein
VSQGKPSTPKVAGKPAKKPAKATRPSSSRTRDKPEPEAQRSVGESETPNEVGAANVDGGQQRAPEDLDDAPGQTTLRDESSDEGYGRSEGPAARRLGQTGEYAADDDELQYGRNLTGRNRIPGAGSKRNR